MEPPGGDRLMKNTILKPVLVIFTISILLFSSLMVNLGEQGSEGIADRSSESRIHGVESRKARGEYWDE